MEQMEVQQEELPKDHEQVQEDGESCDSLGFQEVFGYVPLVEQQS